ncbi:hypothetical protein B0H10DRAFT_1777446 [Mycena sp. CBHHK59/15]|nr:hypothetical protein B0H10DRAFT_1777446 [Mycena sp. CBHHK59/15]
MSNAADVRSILDLPSSSATPAPAPKKLPAPAVRKPDGISRELFSLIGPSSTTLVALVKPRLKQKPNLGSAGKVKWELRPFKNAGRTDSLQLTHWVTASTDPDAEYQFAKYNIQPAMYTYSQDEYTRHLEDPEWTKEETDYLMNVVREYDTRWYVIQDRYDYPGGVPRTMEACSYRYCSVCRKLIRNRPWAGDENSKALLMSGFQFDKEREVLRKKYVASLENRTPEQIAEEEALYMEIKRLEQNERRFKRERDDLLLTIAGIDSGLPDVVEDESLLGGLTIDVKHKKKGRNDTDSPSTPLLTAPIVRRPQTAKNAAYDLQHCITRTDVPQTTATKAAHQPAYLRSFKLPFPKSAVAQKVTQALTELGIAHTRLVMPTQNNLMLLDSVLDATTSLVETKKVVDKVEYEIQVLKTRLGMQTTGKEGELTDPDASVADGMEVGDANDADADADGENEDGRAQSVVSTRSGRSRKHVSARISSCVSMGGLLLILTDPAVDVHLLVDTSATVSTRAGTKRQRRS